MFIEQLLQAIDIVVVNGASSLCHRPFEALAEAFADFSGEVLPAGVAVIARERELGVAQRHGSVARDLLCLFAERVEGRPTRERFRSGHCDLLSSIACTPLNTRLKEGATLHTTQTQTGGSIPLPRGGWRPVSALPPVSGACRVMSNLASDAAGQSRGRSVNARTKRRTGSTV